MNTVNPPTEDRSQSRASFHSGVTWREAIADFLLQTRGSREENTARFYEERLRLLARWGEENGLALADVQARHLRQYLAHRATCAVSDMTRRHDAIAARVFLKFCKREDYVEGDPLAGYQTGINCVTPSVSRCGYYRGCGCQTG